MDDWGVELLGWRRRDLRVGTRIWVLALAGIVSKGDIKATAESSSLKYCQAGYTRADVGRLNAQGVTRVGADRQGKSDEVGLGFNLCVAPFRRCGSDISETERERRQSRVRRS